MENISIIDFPKTELHLLAKWRSDPKVNIFLRQGNRTLSEIDRWYNDYFSGEKNKLFSINMDNRPIGYFTIEHIDSINKNCEFGIVIGESPLHKRGIGSTAITLMLNQAFASMEMHRVYGVIQAGNIASIKCFLKVGFIFEGRHRESRLINNEFRDILYYSILKHEWDKNIK